MTPIAVIDTGTNSTRLLVAEVRHGRAVELARQTRVTRLGEGVDRNGRLSGPGKERVQACVEDYARIIAAAGTRRTVVLATSSVRDAGDGEEFLAGLARSHGFEWKLLSGDEEARLSFAGATEGAAPSKQTLLFDIGGGSTEVAAGRDSRVEFARSVDMGCVRLSERLLPSDPPTAAELRESADFIDRTFAEAGISCEAVGAFDQAIGVAGTVTALAAIDLGLAEYNRERVHGHLLSQERIDALLERLAGMTANERLDEIATMEPGRADVIVGGTLIASRLMRLLGISAFMVSERDILDGAALEYSS